MSTFSEIIQFIRTLYKQPEGVIPLHAPVFEGNEKKYLQECIDTTFVSYVGKFVTQFEEMTSEYTGSKYAVAVVNGTAALHIALLVAGVNFDDEVITQPLTFVATANAIRHANAHPVFIDVDKETLGMSPEKLEVFFRENAILKTNGCFNKVTGRPIKAIVPVHVFGHPCRIDKIVTIAERYKLLVVEDAAEALGSLYKGKHAGTFGLLGILSYNGNKTITTGGGGMILTDDDELAHRMKHITTTGRIPHKYEYIHDVIAYNYRLSNVNAAIGVAQMEYIKKLLNSKRDTAQQYIEFFNSIDGIDFVTEPTLARSNYWLNTLLLRNRKERDEFLEYSNKNNVMSRPAWRLMNKLEMFAGCQTGDLSNAEWLEDRLVNIPSSIIK